MVAKSYCGTAVVAPGELGHIDVLSDLAYGMASLILGGHARIYDSFECHEPGAIMQNLPPLIT